MLAAIDLCRQCYETYGINILRWNEHYTKAHGKSGLLRATEAQLIYSSQEEHKNILNSVFKFNNILSKIEHDAMTLSMCYYQTQLVAQEFCADLI